jgi:hypothetical protein
MVKAIWSLEVNGIHTFVGVWLLLKPFAFNFYELEFWIVDWYDEMGKGLVLKNIFMLFIKIIDL